MLPRLSAAWKRRRERQRQYQIERALYKQGGGAPPPSMQANLPYAPPTVSHDTDLSKLSEDE
jgi:hypothetical protein